jgi:hypothetical protein
LLAPLLSFGVIRVMGLICEGRWNMDSCFCLLRMQIGSVRTRFFQNWRQFESHPFTQSDFSSGADPLWSSIGFLAHTIYNFVPHVVHAWRKCVNLNEEQPISDHSDQTHFSTSWHAKMCLILIEPI